MSYARPEQRLGMHPVAGAAMGAVARVLVGTIVMEKQMSQREVPLEECRPNWQSRELVRLFMD